MGYNHHPLKLRRVLAAYRMRSIRKGAARGPVFLLELAEEADGRMRARRRGRPSAREWNVRRTIPLRCEHWQELKRFAATIGLAPAQVAALLIEHGLARLRTESKLGTAPEIRPGRRPELRSRPETRDPERVEAPMNGLGDRAEGVGSEIREG